LCKHLVINGVLARDQKHYHIRKLPNEGKRTKVHIKRLNNEI
jgi:hypothetical protein